jgi:hypothetical protein
MHRPGTVCGHLYELVITTNELTIYREGGLRRAGYRNQVAAWVPLAVGDRWCSSVGDQAARRWQRHDRVRTMCPKTGSATVIYVVANPRAPAEALCAVRSVDRLNHANPVDSRESAKLLSDDLGLQPALRSQIDVLEVAASAQAGTGDRARWSDPIRAGPQNPHRICPPVTIMAVVGDLDLHSLTGQRVADEDHPALVSSYAVSAVGDCIDLDRTQQSVLT